MEIQSLKLFLTDDDLQALAAKAPPPGEPIEDLKARFTPEGVVVTGRYPTPFFAVAFETTWRLEAAGPEVRAKLADVRVLGLPGNVLGGALMKMVRDAVEGRPGVRVESDSVVVHVGEAARAQGVDLLVRFAAVRLSVGAAVIEAGAAQG
jgi:hypothetical protein